MDSIIIDLSKLNCNSSLVPLGINGSTQKTSSLDGYVEVNYTHLDFFKGVWIKYSFNGIVFSGGNVVDCGLNFISLRSVRGDITNLENLEDYIFYCKKDSQNYKVLQAIIIKENKLSIERKKLLRDKNTFEEEKKKFFLKK